MANDLLLVSSAASYPSDVVQQKRLPVEKHAPSMWADTFTSVSVDIEVQEEYAKAVEALKETVKEMFVAEGNNNAPNDKLLLIDTLERLGLTHHFRGEIEQQLQHISDTHFMHYDLFTVALRFRILRQHHRHVSPSEFDQFKGKDGKFEETLSGDAKGLLSLYEAAQVRTHGEDILEEGLAFATRHLNVMKSTLESPFQDQVKRALEQPLQKGHPRIEASHYISFYERDSSHNETLLKLAKLDFNYVQNLHKKELHDLSIWWKKFDIGSKLPYARNRVTESYFWSLLMSPEPQDSFSRLATVKCILITSILDDTYDNYATIEEAELFTEIIQRWDINEIHRLPDYMKVVYKFIWSTYEELAWKTTERGRSFATPYVKEVIKDICRGYNEELKWFMEKTILTFEAHNSNVLITSTFFILCTPALLPLKSASPKVFEWLLSNPKFAMASARIGRYCDDIGSHEREGRSGQMHTAITMYMKQYGVTEKVAINRFGEMVEDAWKDINEEWCNLPSIVHDEVANVVINFARTAEVFYKNAVDGYTNSESLTPHITSLLINPKSI